jgi:hypothetical protein
MRLAHSLSTGNPCQVASNLMSPPAEPGIYQDEITLPLRYASAPYAAYAFRDKRQV